MAHPVNLLIFFCLSLIQPTCSSLIFSCNSNRSLDGVTTTAASVVDSTNAGRPWLAVMVAAPAFAPPSSLCILLPANRPRAPRFLSFSRMSMNVCENLRIRKERNTRDKECGLVSELLVAHNLANIPQILMLKEKGRHQLQPRPCGEL